MSPIHPIDPGLQHNSQQNLCDSKSCTWCYKVIPVILLESTHMLSCNANCSQHINLHVSVCVSLIGHGLSLIPRLSWEGKESLVMTACTCANPYQQNMVSCFSLEKDIVISWRWCLEDFNKVNVDFWLFKLPFYCASAASELG